MFPDCLRRAPNSDPRGSSEVLALALNSVFPSLLQQRQVFPGQLFLEQFEERLLILIPLEAVLGVADLKALKMKFTENPLVYEAIWPAKDQLRPIAFVPTSLD